METQAVLRDCRLSAQKGRLIADEIRGMPVERAQQFLEYTPKKSAQLFKKLLDSVIANAEHNNGVDIDELKVSAVFVDEGATFKRFRARAKGRGNRILKRTSHITIKVSDGRKGD